MVLKGQKGSLDHWENQGHQEFLEKRESWEFQASQDTQDVWVQKALQDLLGHLVWLEKRARGEEEDSLEHQDSGDPPAQEVKEVRVGQPESLG